MVDIHSALLSVYALLSQDIIRCVLCFVSFVFLVHLIHAFIYTSTSYLRGVGERVPTSSFKPSDPLKNVQVCQLLQLHHALIIRTNDLLIIEQHPSVVFRSDMSNVMS